jgi:hypothetical protein
MSKFVRNQTFGFSSGIMRNQLLLICVVIIIVLFGCKKKQQITYYPVPDALKRACLFQKNSYWIYRNDSTGTTDCTYIKTDPVLSNTSIGARDITEYFMTTIEGNLIYRFYISGEPYSPSVNGYRFLAAMRAGSICNGLVSYAIYSDSLTNHYGGDGCNPCSWKYPCREWDEFVQMGEYSKFNVNSLEFYKVGITRTKFLSPYAFYYYYPPRENDSIDFYFCRGKGLVKIVMKLDTTSNYQVVKRATISWSLLRYNVVQ